MRIAVGSDHAGYEYKEQSIGFLQELGHELLDLGPESSEPVDYPDYAVKVAKAVADGGVDLGLLICGSGIGVAMTANKVSGVRAANCLTPEMAELARQHNDANVLTIGQRLVDWSTAEQIIRTFLDTPASEAERHRARVEKIHSTTGC